MSSFLLRKQTQELLTFGCIRLNANKMSVPVALNNICLLVYNDNIHMIFTGEKLRNFLAMQHHQAIFSKIVKYKELKLQCSVCPNGWNKYDKGKVMFYLEKGIIPSNVKIIAFTKKINCP